jgi:ADP-heptose:LPS heptosyltransferase
MRTLIIHPGAIGDTLLTFPVIMALKEQYPQVHITFVGNRAVLPLAQAWGVANELFDYEDVQWGSLFSTAEIYAPAMSHLLQRTDMAICWLHDPDGVVKQNLLTAGIPHVIVAPGRPPEGMRVHIVEYLAQTVGVKGDVRMLPRLPALPTESLSNVPTSIAIHPGSGGARKCWPVSYFVSIIGKLWQSSIPVLLLAGPADTERLASLMRQLPTPPQFNLLTTVVDAPLMQVAGLLQRCRGYLGNDSGITHLAALLNIPTVALFGPSDLVVWHPIGSSVRVLFEPVLERLPVEVVMRTLVQSAEQG